MAYSTSRNNSMVAPKYATLNVDGTTIDEPGALTVWRRTQTASHVSTTSPVPRLLLICHATYSLRIQKPGK